MGCTFLFISLCMCLGFGLTEPVPANSLITKLPGFNATFPSKHYSGYVSIDGNPAKQLFYYFVESERKPSNDPVVLWLNGGPGCSSFDGFVYEHGPFNYEARKRHGELPILHLNPYSWSKVSNIIYLDSPAGVGFSYSENMTFYSTGDLQTASETNIFLLKWFNLFPEFLSNPFYIAGESYGGIYVPTLASEIVKGVRSGMKPTINLKGYMVGNGVADSKFDGNALVPFAHGMGLISDDIFEEAEDACKGNYYNPNSLTCQLMISKVESVIKDLNLYDILEPCHHSPTSKEDENAKTSLPLSFKQLGVTERPLAVRKRIFGRAWPLRAPVRDGGIVPMWPQLMENSVVPCINDEVATIWLNNDAVRKAIHANPGSGRWRLCTDQMAYTHDAGSMINYHKNLSTQGYRVLIYSNVCLDMCTSTSMYVSYLCVCTSLRQLTGNKCYKNLSTQGYRVLIYSGDHDMCVPFTGSQAWTRSLGYNIVDEWRPWLSSSGVAGFTQGYANNLTFLTIKGAGHTVPEYKPQESLDFYSRWLEGRPI
ncbi:unnamed protein product [Camellia sinensis]